ncbi:MAG TPA: GlsB/YeaQ/YmgE family stress response membrane protein [Phycisphaerae bacterium]|uniref:Transglycosylase associated protein n=1 Tax=marine sediment metagenome TaxID=412755 RepID=A0A0F9AH55_9ZZZZ|nr:GlsB/YeaQ/YmgE family stress response membrane protein [Phycisphaerae bacterium]
MEITAVEVIVWLIVGGIAGSLAGMVVTRKKEGFGRYANLGVGLLGALMGGFIFDFFDIGVGLGKLSISFKDLLSAFLGSLAFLVVVWFVKRWWKKKA